MFVTIISKLYSTQGNKIIKDITIGNNTVQQNSINWSNLILGKLALTQINTKIIKHDLKPKIIPDIKPSIKGDDIVWLYIKSLMWT